MRFNEAPISRSFLPPVQAALRQNSQLQRSSSEIIINEKANVLTRDFESQEFRTGQDTTTYSSFALTRSNKILEHNINNNLDNAYQSSSTESLADYEGYYEEPEEPQDASDEDLSEYSEDGNLPAGCRGIVNPNYPGFQHLGPSLLSDVDDTDDEYELTDQLNELNDNSNCINNNESDSILDETLVNRLDAQRDQHKQLFYERPKFNIQKAASFNESVSHEENKKKSLPSNEIVDADVEIVQLTTSVKEILQFPEIEQIPDSCKNGETEELEDQPTHKITQSQNAIDLIRDVHPVERKQKKQAPPRPPQPIFPSHHQPRNINAYNPFLNPFITFDEPLTSLNQPSIFSCINLEPSTEPLPPSTSSQLTELPESFQQPQPETQHQSENENKKNKLDEIDLLAGISSRQDQINRRSDQQPCVPDVVAMQDQVAALASPSHEEILEDIPREREQVVPALVVMPTRHDVASKREKMMRNQAARRKTLQQQQQQQQQQREVPRHQAPAYNPRAEQYSNMGAFDVYNIETAMPKIDLDVIESHLIAAREEERRRRTDREEIRRRLAMGPDADELRAEKGRKPSLQSRLQSGMNLQICFMNEHSSDTESMAEPMLLSNGGIVPASEETLFSSQKDSLASASLSSASSNHSSFTRFGSSRGNHQIQHQQQQPQRPQMLNLSSLARPSNGIMPNCTMKSSNMNGMNNNNNNNNNNKGPVEDEADFFARQARLQTEARLALAQAKEMARMHMQLERQKLRANPITEMVRSSLSKIGVTLGEERRRLTRGLLTELNIAQLQVLANDLHARIANLNEELVEGLMLRDDLHMEQDSMLVDVEDLTRYLGAKQESLARIKSRPTRQTQPRRHLKIQTSTMSLQTRLAAGRQLMANLVRK
ncbi:hypothetical protein QAD02_023079 [Eretmocerus hayati]|uniref:Uncharacterized protein n=1 Tax=Eretmocerus hayati TaxID=131215 RepID=A0ACC2PZR3_9HYME|nr:hypothetical protein QAD02_023079 [Eretmocerus hayati]